MLYYDRIDISKRTDIAKSKNSKKCMIWHYWFLTMGSNFKIKFIIMSMI